ncbi:hypothetical protein HDU91_004011 [Kappamyces sp. JEL0680]|nr:hypothetical protein HDU91_004011 [Kappamyces sp. JEL0680]
MRPRAKDRPVHTKPAKAAQLPPINHASHGIPLNLYETLSQLHPATSLSMVPAQHVPQAATMMPVPVHPAYLLNPLAFYWPLGNQQNFAIPQDANRLHEA